MIEKTKIEIAAKWIFIVSAAVFLTGAMGFGAPGAPTFPDWVYWAWLVLSAQWVVVTILYGLYFMFREMVLGALDHPSG